MDSWSKEYEDENEKPKKVGFEIRAPEQNEESIFSPVRKKKILAKTCDIIKLTLK